MAESRKIRVDEKFYCILEKTRGLGIKPLGKPLSQTQASKILARIIQEKNPKISIVIKKKKKVDDIFEDFEELGLRL